VTLAATEDTAVTFTTAQLLGSSYDIDSPTLSVSGVTATHGTVVNNGNGTWTFTPAADYNGAANLSFNISDGQLSTPSSAVINIAAVNDAPVAVPVTLAATEDTSVTFTTAQLLGTSYDVDNPTLNVLNVTATHGTVVNNGNGTWTFTPTHDYNGVANLSYSISDGTLSTASSATINIAAVNDAPVAVPVTLAATEDTAVTFTTAQLLGTSSDVDSASLSIVNVTAAHGTVVNNGNGTWTFTPDANYNGVATLSYSVSDGQLSTPSSATINVAAVNDAPVAVPVTLAATEDTAVTFTTAQLLGSSYDIDSSNLSIVNLSAAHGTVVNNGNGTWTFTPEANYSGPATLNYGISDGLLTSNSSATINIAAVNDAPVVTPVYLTMNEDSTLIINESTLLAHATDVDSSTLSITTITSPQGALVNNHNGTWSFTPVHDFNGPLTFSFGVSDGQITTTQSMYVHVQPVNDAPVAGSVAMNMQEDGTLLIHKADLLRTAYDVDGDVLNVTNITAPQGTIHYVGNDTWSFAPAANFNGSLNLQFTVSDGSVTVNQTLQVNVAAVNDAPVVSARSFTMLEDGTPIVITNAQLIAGSTDVDSATLTATNVSLANGSQGTLVNNNNGTWTFTPAANFNGNVALYYSVSDGAAATANVANITVTPVNDAPVVGAISNFSTTEDTGIIITQTALLAHTTDVDSSNLSISAISVPANQGTILSNGNGTWTFMPAANYNGTATISYSVSDGTTATAGTANVIISAVNDAPVVNSPNAFSMNEDGTLSITQASLLGNASDVDGNTLTVTSVSVPAAEGTISGNSGGPWTFTPADNFNGAATLTFTTSDGIASPVSQTAVVNVAAVNDAPTVAMPAAFSMNEDGGTLSITQAALLARAFDIDGNATLTVTGVSVPANQGTISGSSGGPWTFTPAHDFNGVATLTFTTSDGTSATSQNAIVNITPVNDAPVIATVSFNATEDTSIILRQSDFLSGAGTTDADGNVLSVTNVTVPAAQGSIFINGNGNWIFTPAANFNGAATLTFTASDGTSTVNQSAIVNVAAVNDIPVVNAPTALSMNEDGTPIQITQAYLLTNSSDADGNTLTVTSVSVPAEQGTITGNVGGPWTFTPARDFNGVANITYKVSDGIISTPVSQVAIVNIAAVADSAKFIIDDQKVLDPDFNLTGSNFVVQHTSTTTETVNTSDIQNASIKETYTSANNVQLQLNSGEVQNAYAWDDTNGTVKLTGFERSDVTLGDGGANSVTLLNSSRGDINLGSGTDTVNITSIADANAPTVSDAYTGYTIKDQSYGNYNITTGNSVDNITLSGTYSSSHITTGAGNDIINAGDGDDIIDAGAGNDTINTGGGWDTIYAGLGNDTVDSGSGVGVHNPSDQYGDTIIFSGGRNEYTVTLSSSKGTYTVTDLMPNRDGIDKFTHVEKFQFTDGMWFSSVIPSTGSANGPYLESDVNNAPVVPAVTLSSIVEDASSPLSITQSQLLSGLTKDVENQTMSILSVSVPAAQGTIAGSGTGPWTFTPAHDFNGTATITFVVSDNGTNASAVHYTQTASVTVTPVNDAPVAGGTPVTFSTAEDSAILISATQLLANTTDADSSNLSIASISVNQGTITNLGNGMYSYNPPANYNGNAVISFTVSDGTLTSATQTATVAVTAVNDAPVVNAPTAYTMNEDGTLSITQASLLVNASDADGNALTVTSVSVPASEGTISGNAGGPWTFTPAANFNGAATLSFTTSDGVASVSQTATVNVTAVNDAPVVAMPAAFAMNEDGGTLSITQAALLARAGDIDGNSTLTVTSVTVPAAQGTISGASGGPWTFTPAHDFNGVATLTFSTSDGTATTSQNAIVNVAAVNDVPIVNSLPTLTTTEDNAIIIGQSTLLAGVTDADGNALSVTNVTLTNSAQGTIISNGDGTWTYSPAANFNGTAALTFTVSDGSTTVNQAINVAVTAVNDAPIVNAVNMSMSEDGSLSFTNSQLLASAGATDVEGSALSISSVTTSVGTLTFAGGTWTLNNLPLNFNGQIPISFTVSDGSATTSQALNVTVNPVNDAPALTAVSVNMLENSAILFTQADLLAHATDVDSSNLTVTGITAAQGILTDNGNGTWTYSPAANFSGSVNLHYTVSDGQANTTQQIGVNVVHNANDLHFDVNGQQASNPNYTTGDNTDIGQPVLFNHDYITTPTDGSHILSNFSATDNASVTLQSSSAPESIDATSQNASSVTIHDFNRTDVNLGNDGNSNVNIYNTNRGDITTGNGSDTINVTTNSVSDTLGKIININTGEGNDHVTIVGNNDSSIFNIHAGNGDNTIDLQGKYSTANIFGGSGNDTINALDNSNNLVHFGAASGHDTFNAGSGMGWADTIVLDHSAAVSVTQTDVHSWTLVVDGQEATLTTDTTGTVTGNHLDFAASANGVLTMHDGSTMNFNHVEHVEW
jgi:VCBS repeat-containing protein